MKRGIRRFFKTIGLPLFVGIFFVIKPTGEILAGSYSESKAKAAFAKEMIETSRQINRQLPMMVDQETRLDTTMVLNRDFYYKYTLINYKGTDVDKSRLYEWAESALKTSFCDNDNIKKLLMVGVKFNYMYYGKDGVQIIVVTLDSNKCSVTSSSKAQDWQTFRNREFKFRFVYPPDWQTATPRGPNVRGSINTPQNKPFANCSIVVRYVADLSNFTQKELNNEIYSETWSKQYWEEAFSDKFPDTVAYEAKKVRIDNRPAQFAITGYSAETLDRKSYMKTMNFMTMTPGYFWHFGCGAAGESEREADKNFKYWEPTFNKIFSSFVFEEGLY